MRIDILVCHADGTQFIEQRESDEWQPVKQETEGAAANTTEK